MGFSVKAITRSFAIYPPVQRQNYTDSALCSELCCFATSVDKYPPVLTLCVGARNHRKAWLRCVWEHVVTWQKKAWRPYEDRVAELKCYNRLSRRARSHLAEEGVETLHLAPAPLLLLRLQSAYPYTVTMAHGYTINRLGV